MATISTKTSVLDYIDLGPIDAPCLIYVHGNSHSKENFLEVMRSAELAHYRHVALDLPGHGLSEKGHQYSLPMLVDSLVEFIEKLALSRYVLIGHSLGGHIAVQAAPRLQSEGVFVFGTPLLSRPLPATAFLPNELMSCLMTESSPDEMVGKLLNEIGYQGKSLSIAWSDYLATDPKFRSDLLKSLSAGDCPDELAIVASLPFRTHMLLTEGDTLVNNSYIMEMVVPYLASQVTTSVLAGGHSPHVQSPALLTKELAGYLELLSAKPIMPYENEQYSITSTP